MKRITEGLVIISKYDSDGDFAAGHDQIWAGGELCVDTMSEEDKTRMDDIGWFVDDEFGCWSHFC